MASTETSLKIPFIPWDTLMQSACTKPISPKGAHKSGSCHDEQTQKIVKITRMCKTYGSPTEMKGRSACNNTSVSSGKCTACSKGALANIYVIALSLVLLGKPTHHSRLTPAVKPPAPSGAENLCSQLCLLPLAVNKSPARCSAALSL